jgi:hypothetical protein
MHKRGICCRVKEIKGLRGGLLCSAEQKKLLTQRLQQRPFYRGELVSGGLSNLIPLEFVIQGGAAYS